MKEENLDEWKQAVLNAKEQGLTCEQGLAIINSVYSEALKSPGQQISVADEVTTLTMK